MTHELQKRMDRALERQYVACMFDYDGTLVERGYHMPLPQYIPSVLQDTSRKAYMAICTARPFEGAFRDAHHMLGKHFDDLRSKWVWICENGGAGYLYDEESGTYKEFYRVAWPTNVMSKEDFIALVHATFDNLVAEVDVNESVIILRPQQVNVPAEEIAIACEKIQNIGLNMLKEHGLEDEIRLGNSSLGVILYGVDSDKDRGVAEFGKLLASRGVALSDDLREIILFGDRPVRYGNDAYFLNGKLGKPVTVGEDIPEREDLISVIDENGKRLMGPSATTYLLRKLSFKTF
ncbi:MAG: hypothetical protein NTX63_02065 [Candidatus Peregrinibacteria bacterium]|nr:hypothetical protein [Candidatus Peregrinibacteria bacterium]